MNTGIIRAALACAGLAIISGCSETGGSSAPSAGAALRTGSAADEQACDRAVATETGNGETVVLSSQFSEANTEVIVGVGPQQARWRCLISRGVVQEVTSLTNEGAL